MMLTKAAIISSRVFSPLSSQTHLLMSSSALLSSAGGADRRVVIDVVSDSKLDFPFLFTHQLDDSPLGLYVPLARKRNKTPKDAYHLKMALA